MQTAFGCFQFRYAVFIYIIIICTKQPTSKFVVDNTMGSVL